MTPWFEKQRHLIDYTLAALWRRRGRNLGLLAVYGLLVFVLASAMLFSHALRREAAVILDGAPEIVLQRLVAGRHDLIPPGYIERIGRLRGVQQIHGRLWGYYYDPVVKANFTFLVPGDNSVPAGQLIVGPALARSRGLDAGTGISLRSYSGELFSFAITQVLPEASELASADLILINEADFRRFFAYPEGHYTDIALSVANPTEVRTIAGKLVKLLPDSRPILRDEMKRTYASLFDWREGLMLALLSAAILAFAILAWDKAAGLSADEKREIGILKAIGWETGDVIAMKLWEGALLSLTAFLAGFVAAYVHVFKFGAPLFEPVLKGWAVLYPRFDLTPVVDGLQLATLFFFSVFPFLAAVMVPIWRAAVTDPDAVMR
jgi:ABC-type lipoprotein release transport system permease subunit